VLAAIDIIDDAIEGYIKKFGWLKTK
jgi:hypothetical protein